MIHSKHFNDEEKHYNLIHCMSKYILFPPQSAVLRCAREFECYGTKLFLFQYLSFNSIGKNMTISFQNLQPQLKPMFSQGQCSITSFQLSIQNPHFIQHPQLSEQEHYVTNRSIE